VDAAVKVIHTYKLVITWYIFHDLCGLCLGSGN